MWDCVEAALHPRSHITCACVSPHSSFQSNVGWTFSLHVGEEWPWAATVWLSCLPCMKGQLLSANLRSCSILICKDKMTQVGIRELHTSTLCCGNVRFPHQGPEAFDGTVAGSDAVVLCTEGDGIEFAGVQTQKTECVASCMLSNIHTWVWRVLCSVYILNVDEVTFSKRFERIVEEFSLFTHKWSINSTCCLCTYIHIFYCFRNKGFWISVALWLIHNYLSAFAQILHFILNSTPLEFRGK